MVHNAGPAKLIAHPMLEKFKVQVQEASAVSQHFHYCAILSDYVVYLYFIVTVMRDTSVPFWLYTRKQPKPMGAYCPLDPWADPVAQGDIF